jgi:hypothetical protein
MRRRASPENLYIAHRMALAARLVAETRITPENAERCIAAWEAEARLRGLDGRSGAWWEPAWDLHRGADRVLASERP